MSKEKSLLVFSGVINYTNTGYKINGIFAAGYEKIVATLMTSITINPF